MLPQAYERVLPSMPSPLAALQASVKVLRSLPRLLPVLLAMKCFSWAHREEYTLFWAQGPPLRLALARSSWSGGSFLYTPYLSEHPHKVQSQSHHCEVKVPYKRAEAVGVQFVFLSLPLICWHAEMFGSVFYYSCKKAKVCVREILHINLKMGRFEIILISWVPQVKTWLLKKICPSYHKTCLWSRQLYSSIAVQLTCKVIMVKKAVVFKMAWTRSTWSFKEWY